MGEGEARERDVVRQRFKRELASHVREELTWRDGPSLITSRQSGCESLSSSRIGGRRAPSSNISRTCASRLCTALCTEGWTRRCGSTRSIT